MRTNEEFARCIDATLLKPNVTEEDMLRHLENARRCRFKTVAIGCAWIPCAREVLAGSGVGIDAPIGFPNGYSTTEVKVFETEDAISNGADEIDMVINIGWAKDQRWDDILNEIKAIKASCQGRILKVIVETCLLTEAEKIKLCELVTASGADYIKTSTGFSTGGATREDVALFARHVGPGVKIKAAGGISSMQDAEDFLALGADRLGTSRIVKLIKGQQGEGY